MSESVIRIAPEGTEFDGAYVVEYDPSRDGVSPSGQYMVCHLRVTLNPAEARRFTSAEAALAYYMQAYGVRPNDGKPNRPLTALTIEVLPAPKLTCFIHRDRDSVRVLNIPCAPGGRLLVCEECFDPANRQRVFEVYMATHHDAIAQKRAAERHRNG